MKLAHLGEHLIDNQKVIGSIPIFYTENMSRIWDDGVQGWRTGLKNRGRPFDSGSSHQLLRSSTLCTRCMVTCELCSQIPQEGCEWNENPFPYISETYGTKNYIYEKFFTPVARLLFYLIVYIIWTRGRAA